MDESNQQQDVEPEIAEYPEAGPLWVGLWAVARHWVALLEQVFEPGLLAAGIKRSSALRCRNWLWSIESLVRRLIIAAAMQLPDRRDAIAPATPDRPKPSSNGQGPAGPKPAALHIAFTVLPSAGQPRAAPAQRPARQPPEHRHLGFPGDALLGLFSRHARPGARAGHGRHPLHRRGRRSRWDPDYQYDPVKAEESYNRHFFGPARKCPGGIMPRPEPRPRTRADRSSPWWKAPNSNLSSGDVPEWKRLEQEWARVIPSPGLAGRVRALMRVMEKPERWIARTARRLRAETGLFGQLCEIAPPRLKKPKLDRGSLPPLLAELGQAHAQAFPDTS
jgi:hypothetical protein